MADIFISYASADRERARQLAAVLASQGWSVWWDRTIPPGRTFDQVIEQALQAARCVVVLWSQRSSSSEWVKTEAAEGKKKGILVPAVIERVAIPLEFRRVQAADLSGWRGDADHPELLTLLQSIRGHLEARGMDAESVPREPEHLPGIWGPTNRRRAWTRSHLALLVGLVGVLTLGTFVTVRLLTAPSSVPVAKDRRQIESPSQKPSTARDVPRSSSGLAAPAPLEPACGSVIPFDRPMMLSWRPVEGASTYTVEVDCLGCGGPQSGWSSQAGVPWHIREQLGLRSPIYNAADLLSRLRQSGGRALRWRVWALGHDGQESEKSAWCQIAFKGDPRRPTP